MVRKRIFHCVDEDADSLSVEYPRSMEENDSGFRVPLECETESTINGLRMSKRNHFFESGKSLPCDNTTMDFNDVARNLNSVNCQVDEINSGTTMNRHGDDADLHQTIADMMCKMKHGKRMVSDQAESSSKRTCLSVGTSHQSLPSLDSEMHANDSSDDETQEDSDNEDVHRVLSGLDRTIYGQASYQRTQSTYPGVIVDYNDSGDDVYICEHCAALFWLDEALKKKKNNRLIYTHCCEKGQVQLPISCPTPAFS